MFGVVVGEPLPVRRAAWALARALRPKQWLKNLLVFAAPGAAGILAQGSTLERSAVAFISLCAVASAGYLVNDTLDLESDRDHPVKRRRPIASGDLSVRAAIAAAAALAVLGTIAAVTLGPRFALVVAVYLATTVSYTLWLKRIEVVDVAVVASFFVLRALAGAAATQVPLSPWFLILISSASMFVVAGKRYGDLLTLEAEGRTPSGAVYTAAYLRYLWILASGFAMAAYSLWAFAQPHLHEGIAWSEISIVPFALAILRYALVLDAGDGGAPEEILLRDRPLEVFAVLWVLVYGAGVYLR